MAVSKQSKVIAAVLVSIVVIISTGVGIGLRSSKKTVLLEVQPMPSDSSRIISYSANDKGSVQKWVNIINDFLREYRRGAEEVATNVGNRVPCNATHHHLKAGQVCDVTLDSFGPCSAYNRYNYDKGSPCVFLSMNNILNWAPDPYTSKPLPDRMPFDLQYYISNEELQADSSSVWVSCEGVNPTDVENIGEIHYMPSRGFPVYYYPFTNQEGYLRPLVAVIFEKPIAGVLISIECKTWAKNIQQDSFERGGSTFFELMVDMP